MEQKDNTRNAELKVAQSQAIEHWESANQSYNQFQGTYRKTCEEIWKCGRALCEVREKGKRGEWVKWLTSVDIPPATAYRWMKFSQIEFSKIPELGSVNQGLKALPLPRPKDKEQDKEVEPDVAEGKASSVQQEEVTDGEGTPSLPVEMESPQEIQQLRDKLRETGKKLSKAEEEVAELHETKDQLRVAEERIAELLQENKQLKRQLEEKGTPKETTSVDQQQIYPHSAFSENSEDPGSGGARTTAAPVSRKNTENPDPI